MKLKFETETEFQIFKDKISQELNQREKRILESPNLTPAAVMLLLMNKKNEPYVLLIKRAENVSTHKGEMAFPGGTYEEDDSDILETALRETHEEVGVKSADIELLGSFDEYISLQGFHVSTFVGAINYPYEYTLNFNEIDEYVEVPFSLFFNREYSRIEKFDCQGKSFNIYYYYYDEYEIWGLTARILTDFSSLVAHKINI